MVNNLYFKFSYVLWKRSIEIKKTQHTTQYLESLLPYLQKLRLAADPALGGIATILFTVIRMR